MAEMNPLQILGMVNQFQQKPTENKALRDLQTKSSIMSQQQSGANARNTANLGNAMRVAALNKDIGLSPQESMVGGSLSPTTLGTLRTTRNLRDSLIGGQAIDAARSGGVGLADPKKAFLPKDVPSRPLIGGFPLKGEAAALAELQSKQKQQTTKTGPERQKGGGYKDVTQTESAEQQSKSKGGKLSSQRAEQLHSIVTQMLSGKGFNTQNVKIISEGGDHIMISIDGKPPQRVDMNKIPQK